jgi:hypothetical protein
VPPPASVRTTGQYVAGDRARSSWQESVALEEADESAFWLEIIVEIRMVAGNLAAKLLDEANQLAAILAASSITRQWREPSMIGTSEFRAKSAI